MLPHYVCTRKFNPCSFCQVQHLISPSPLVMLFLLAEAASVRSKEHHRQVSTMTLDDNRLMQLFPPWLREAPCWGSIALVAERILPWHESELQQTWLEVISRDYSIHHPPHHRTIANHSQLGPWTSPCQLLKPRTAEPMITALLPAQHKLSTQDSFSWCLAWSCRDTVCDCCPWCHQTQAVRVWLHHFTILTSWGGLTCKHMLMKVDKP